MHSKYPVKSSQEFAKEKIDIVTKCLKAGMEEVFPK
jgi:hypothetical protein